jgi:O-antigen/teichoic acid export membrane protein
VDSDSDIAADNISSNTYVFTDSLQRLVKGTGLVIIGSILINFFGLISGILIARKWDESYVGIFSLAYSIFNICLIISALGMNIGVVRCIAHSRGKKEFNKISDFIVTSIFYSVFISIILGLILFLFSEIIAVSLFHETFLVLPLKIFAIALPIFVLNIKIVNIFRGFENLKPLVYFKYILENAFFLVFIAAIVIINLSFNYIFYTYLTSGIIITFILIIYITRQSLSLKNISIKSFISPAAKELIVFSLPLFISSIFDLIIIWNGTLLLGGFKGIADVGFYHVAKPFATFISFPMIALAIIHVPIFSELYAKGQLKEMKSNYTILTKWIFLVTLPLFIVLFLFPESILKIIVGSNYLPATEALRILSLAYIISNFVGPCRSTLVALGRSRFIMLLVLSGAILNIILNVLLIPTYSFIGVAIAAAVTLIFMDIIQTWKMYSLSKISPVSKNLIKPTFFSIIFIVPIYFIFKELIFINLWTLIILFILLYTIFLISVLVTKSLDEEDLKLVETIERKTGINIPRLKKFLNKFQ